MQIKMIPLTDIIPYENNPRKNADAVKYVANSIREFGFRIPMVLDSENVIVCGHTRFLAAQELGMTEVPCIYADDLTEEQIKAFRLADNKTAEIAEWDFERLELEIQDIDGIDMSDFGFEEPPGFMDFMNDDFGVAGDSESFGTVTLTFDSAEEAEEVKSYIKKNEQAGILQVVLNYVRGL